MIRRAIDALSNIGTLTNLQTKTNLRRDLATALLINLLDGTLVQPGTALHTYLDDSTGKSALFSWKTVANLYDVLNSFLVMILWEHSIDLQMDLAKTMFLFPQDVICQDQKFQNLGSHLVESNKYLDW